MKNKILDDIFNDNLRKQLEEGEVVIWEGKPQFNNYNRLVTAGFLFLFIGVNLINSILGNHHWLTAIIIVALVFSVFRLFFRQKKTRYLVTNARVIFQLPNKRKTQIHSLPLHQIEDVIYEEGRNKNGTITLTLKKTFKTDIKTIDLKKNVSRKNPTLELIENVEDVGNYIQQAIEGKL